VPTDDGDGNDGATEALGSGAAGRSSLEGKHSFNPTGVSAPRPHTKPGAQGATPFPIVSSGMQSLPCVPWQPM